MKIPNNVQEEAKRFTRLQKILISIIVVLIIIGTSTVAMGSNIITKEGYDVLSMIRYSLIEHPIESIVNWQKDLANLRSVQQENEELKVIISSQDMYKAELDEKNRKIEELESLMNLDSISLYDKVYASVISRDISAWNNSLTLNKGSDDGIAEDMAVVTSKGLIGKVISVNKKTCVVKLLTTSSSDLNVSLRVELKKGTTDGVLQSYDENDNLYSIQIYDSHASIKEGMKVITSGNGGVFPSGILVGTVKEVKELYNAKGKVVTVVPSVDFNDFEYVAVLKVK